MKPNKRAIEVKIVESKQPINVSSIAIAIANAIMRGDKNNDRQ